MGGFEIVLDVSLVFLLGVTLVQAVRLQRAIGGVRAGQVGMSDAVAGFDSGARQAEAGLSQLRIVAAQLAGDMGRFTALRDDLAFLADRSDTAADRLEALIRTSRGVHASVDVADVGGGSARHRARSKAEQDLALALRGRA